MTDIREEFARIAESRRKPPISGSNIGYNCALDEMFAELRALPSVCGGEVPEGWQLVPKEPTEVMTDAASFEESEGWKPGDDHNDFRRLYRAMLTNAPVHEGVLLAMLKSPSPPPVSAREESIRNAIAAMERIAQFGDVVRVNDDGTEEPAHKVIYTIEGHRACREIAATALAALKREVGNV